MNIGHGFSDVKLATVKLELEVGAEFFHEQLHLLRVSELGMITGKLTITHDTLHEVCHKEAHFGVASELIVKRRFLFLDFQVNLGLSSRGGGCRHRGTIKRTLSHAGPAFMGLVAAILDHGIGS